MYKPLQIKPSQTRNAKNPLLNRSSEYKSPGELVLGICPQIQSKGLFTWSGGPRSSGVGFLCFHALGDTKQKKLTSLDRGPPLHVNRV